MRQKFPIVSFCFDDFPRTAYSTGGKILEEHGVRGTYYAAAGLMNTSNELGEQFTRGDIDELMDAGHEVGSHTFHHYSGRRVPRLIFEKDALLGRDAIRDMTGSDAGSFAYPFGHVPLRSKARLGAHMSSCRSIYGGVNGPLADLNLLKANSLYGDVDQAAKALALLQQNGNSRGWLIFYTHDVSRHASPFGCTPALLRKIVEETLERGFQIVTVAQGNAMSCQLKMQSPTHTKLA